MNRYFALLALLAATAAGPATAEERQVAVRLSASELGLTEAQLRSRLAPAIEEACGSYAAIDPDLWWELEKCRQSAWASAKRQVAELRARRPIMVGQR
jgi:UrcA family protein